MAEGGEPVASMSVNFTDLKRLAAVFDNPAIQAELERLTMDKGVAAIIAQAIADNFDKQGPGWAPLKGSTIRKSIGKKLLASVKKEALARMTGGFKSVGQVRKQKKMGELNAIMDKMLVRHERKFSGTDFSNRAILRKTGLLMKSVTTPNAPHSLWPARNEKYKLVWGSDLVYAGVHNYGYPNKNIPKREFLVIRDEWNQQMKDYVLERAFRLIRTYLRTL